MRESQYELVNGTANTVGELIKLLENVPSNYAITLSGMKTFGVLMDVANETVLMDDINYIDELLEESEEE